MSQDIDLRTFTLANGRGSWSGAFANLQILDMDHASLEKPGQSRVGQSSSFSKNCPSAQVHPRAEQGFGARNCGGGDSLQSRLACWIVKLKPTKSGCDMFATMQPSKSKQRFKPTGASDNNNSSMQCQIKEKKS